MIQVKGNEEKDGWRNWKAWRFITLTGVTVPVSKENFGTQVKAFGDTMESFLSDQYPDGGLAVIEHTSRYRTIHVVDIESSGDFLVQWGSYIESVQFVGPATVVSYEQEQYLHAHAICFGEEKTKPKFEEAWGLALMNAGFLTREDFVKVRTVMMEKKPGEGYEAVEGGRFVGLSTVRNAKGTTKYVLKYLAKGVGVSDEYLESLYRLKYVRSWGSLYKRYCRKEHQHKPECRIEPTYDLVCQDCGAKCYVMLDDSTFEEYYGQVGLRYKRMLREITGPP
jgi:hypothetical protein